jgi:hypothetical protein
MSPIKTIALLLIAVAIVAVYIWDKDNVAEKKAAEELEKDFVAVESKDVMKLTIDRAGNKVTAERNEENWKVVDPVEWPGDKFAWKAIADNLASAKISRRFPDEGETLTDKQLEMWGIANPQLKLTATIRDGSKEITLQFGNNPPDSKSSVYAVSSEKEGNAFIIPQAVVTSCSKELHDLRDLTIFDIDFGTVTQLEVSNKSLAFVAKKDDNGKWILPDHGKIRAADENVSTYVSKLNLKAFKILDNLPEERVRELGLADDQLASATRYRTVTADGASHLFHVGAFVPDSEGYVGKREGTESLFVIKRYFFESVKETIEELRPSKAIPLQKHNTDIIRATADGAPLYAIEKVDYNWRMGLPHSATAERDAVDALVNAFNDNKIGSYLKDASSDAELGLDNPQLIIYVEGDGKSETVLFGNRDGAGSVYAAWAGYADRFLLDQEILDKLKKDPLDLLTKDERKRIEEEVLDLTEEEPEEPAAESAAELAVEPASPPKSETKEAASGSEAAEVTAATAEAESATP